MRQDRIQRRGFARAGGAGNEDDPFRPRDHDLEQIKLSVLQPERIERNQIALPVEDAQDEVFAVNGGLRGNPKIDLPPG